MVIELFQNSDTLIRVTHKSGRRNDPRSINVFHSHKCSCGCLWAHADTISEASRRTHNKAHECPSCGTAVRLKHHFGLTPGQCETINARLPVKATGLGAALLSLIGLG